MGHDYQYPLVLSGTTGDTSTGIHLSLIENNPTWCIINCILFLWTGEAHSRIFSWIYIYPF